MVEKNDAEAGDLAGWGSDGVRGPPELRFEGLASASGGGDGEGQPDHRAPAAAGASGARYKAMSPARLPIARAPCLTIPPGFSPSALLESPVLLTNVKAEPSPTTGTFNMPLVMDKTVRSDSLSSPRDPSNNNVHDEGSSADFEFKPHIRSAPSSGLSSLGTLASVNRSQQQHAPSLQVQTKYQTQMLTSSQLHNADNTTISSHELSLSVTAPNSPVEATALKVNVTAEVASNEQQQTKCSESSTLVLPVHNGSSPSNGFEKSSEDGYNWRKYGQKHVKGSEYPRSYYKCTHPNCQMKKQLERSHDGQITEIIYKGRHDHPKPQPSRRLAVGTIPSSQGDEKPDGISPLISSDDKSSNARISHSIDPNGTSELSPVSASDDDVEAGGTRSNYMGDEVADDDDPESKRRKMDSTSIDATHIGKPNREPRVVVQTVSEVDILDDGYRWRKYGQKVVKGNPNPRSYYKCTNAGCPVRKHVERASHDPKAVITTYEGKHNHDVPAAKTVNHDTSVPTITDGANSISNHMPAAMNDILRTCDTRAVSHQYICPEESDTISLDLGVGISPRHNAVSEKQPCPGTDQIHSQMQSASSVCSNVVIQTSPISALYGSSSNGLYGSRESKGEGFTFNTPPINRSSNLYYTGTGNLVMGP